MAAPLGDCPHVAAVDGDAQLRRFQQKRWKRGVEAVSCNKCGTKKEDLWACLHGKCDVVGCGRTSNGHALRHAEEQHKSNGKHVVVVNIFTGMVWCYGCDTELLVLRAGEPGSRISTEAAAKLMTVLASILPMYDTKALPAAPAGPLPPPLPPSKDAPAAADAGPATDEDAVDTRTYETIRPSSRHGLVGLENLGNTCYMNASLQALSNSVPLRAYVRSPSGAVVMAHNVPPIVSSFYELLQALWDGEDDAVTPSALVREVRTLNPSFRGFSQQDAQEFLRFFLDRLHDELRQPVPTAPASPTPPAMPAPAPPTTSPDAAAVPTSAGTANGKPATVRPSLLAHLHIGGGGGTGNGRKDKESGPAGEAATSKRRKRGSNSGTQSEPVAAASEPEAEGNPESDITAPLGVRRARGVPDRKGTLYASIISDTFAGVLQSRVVCLTCGKESISHDPFYDLSISISKRPERPRPSSPPPTSAPAPAQPVSTADEAAERPAEASTGTGAGDSADASAAALKHARSTSSSGTSTDSTRTRSSLVSGALGALRLTSQAVMSAVSSFLPGSIGSSGQASKLVDCLTSFFSPEELSGTEQYRCEFCKALRDCTKTLRIQNLPEMLCIHLKRFRYDGFIPMKISNPISFPLEGLSFKPFVIDPATADDCKYDLTAIVNHRGGVGGGHYVAYGRNDVDGRWYEYDDRRVTLKTPTEVERVEAYLLFYRRKSPARATERKRAETLVHPIAPAADAASTDAVLISRAWYIRWLTCVDPGPVTNADLLCPHGALSRRVSVRNANVSELVYEVPRSLYLEWCKRFGSDGLPATTALPACKACADYEAALAQRRVEENDQISALDSVTIADGHVWYIIASAWLRQWTDFKKGGPLPGPVDNKVLVDARGNARPGLQKVADYRGVNEAVWNYFVAAYGGGPALPRPVLDIYATPVVKAAAAPPPAPAPDTAMNVDTTTTTSTTTTTTMPAPASEANGHEAPLSDGEGEPQDPDATGGNDSTGAPTAPLASTNGTPSESASAAAASKKKKKKKKTRATSESAVSDAGDDAQSDAA